METDDFTGTKILITGGAGFVGANLVRKLAEAGGNITILDDLFTGKEANLAQVKAPYRLIVGSVTDRNLVDELVADVEIVFHLAARNIIASTRNPYDDFQTNIGGTLNVLLAARDHKIQRVVYTSTASVYGNPRHLPISEDEQISLLSPYAVSKYGGEGYCQAFYESYSVPVTVVRYSNVYGIGQDPTNPYCGVVSKFMQKAQKGLALEIHGDGQQTRDFTFVEDAVEATLAAALSPRAVGEVFNIGSGIETSINTLAGQIARMYQLNLPILHIDRRDIDNIRRRVMNIEKIRRYLRWVPRYTLAQGLASTKQWFDALENG